MRLVTLSLLIVIMLLATAKAITVTPSSYTTTQKIGDYDTIIFKVTNPENHSVNVTITMDEALKGKISFNTTFFEIPPNSTYNATAVLSKSNPVSGQIYFNNVSVLITVKELPATNLTIIPATPMAGKNIIFVMRDKDLAGYLFIQSTNNVYPVIIEKGIGYVSLSEEDYGDAIIVLYGDEIYFQTIKILPPKVENIYVIFPSSIKVGDNITFSVFADGKPIKAKLKFDGADNFTVTTREDGKVTVVFKKVGNYTLKVNYFNYTKIEYIKVFPKTLEISIPDKIMAGNTIKITTEPNAKITIKCRDTIWTYTASSDGTCFFTPPFPGIYNITAKTQNKEGRKTFTVKATTHISVIGTAGTQVNTIKKGDTILIQVLDANNNPVQDSSIDVYVDGLFYKTLNIIGDSTLWKVDKAGKIYEFKYNPSNDNYLPCSLTLYGKNSDYSSFPINSVILILLIIVGIIIVLFASGIIDVEKIKWFFRKEKIPL